MIEGAIFRLGRFARSVRHLSARQIGSRARRQLLFRAWRLWRRRAPRPAPPPLDLLACRLPGLPDIAAGAGDGEALASALARARNAQARRFCFLNLCVDCAREPAWHDHRLPHLWRYHLQYFDYAIDLAVLGSTGPRVDAFAAFRSLTLEWIAQHRRLEGDGWHPYTISLRLVNWLTAAAAFEAELAADPSFLATLSSSAFGQARTLARLLEHDVRGNHLVKNLRALVLAGLVFRTPEARRWGSDGLALLQRELDEQVASDGGHFERAPGYHVAVMCDLIDVSRWLKQAGRTPPAWLEGAIVRMRGYLAAILPPDQQLPLLKDTAYDAVPSPLDVLAAAGLCLSAPRLRPARAGWYRLLSFGAAPPCCEDNPVLPARTSVALTASGHFVLQAGDNGLIFDVGPTCPDYLPAHAHADLLTYELWVEGVRLVTDSGVLEYTAGPWRSYFRSTRAHNTVELDGQDQSEVWASFRVGHRARPRGVVHSFTAAGDLVQAAHDGYLRGSRRALHRRTVARLPQGVWVIADEITAAAPRVAKSYVHLAPQVKCEQVDERTWRLVSGASVAWLTAFGHDTSEQTRGAMEPRIQGWYSECFGERFPASVLTLTAWGRHVWFGYTIATREPAAVSRIDPHVPSVTVRRGRFACVLVGTAEAPRLAPAGAEAVGRR